MQPLTIVASRLSRVWPIERKWQFARPSALKVPRVDDLLDRASISPARANVFHRERFGVARRGTLSVGSMDGIYCVARDNLPMFGTIRD